MATVEFAVVDVETTGFDAWKKDRVVEVAVVRTDATGVVLHEYHTLVNPKRDVGRVSVHGIRPSDVARAPDFSQVTGDVIGHLKGAVLVAHNASFDKRFLAAEMKRVGVVMPRAPWLCTLELSAELGRESGSGIGERSLGKLCAKLGLEHDAAHWALGDAKATAKLLSVLLRQPSARRVLDEVEPQPGSVQWPMVGATGLVCPRASKRDEAEQGGRSFLARLIEKLPSVEEATVSVNQYLHSLEAALVDRQLSQEEASSLAELAMRLGLLKEQITSAHERYLRALIEVAMADGKLTEAEKADLERVRFILDVAQTTFAQLLIDAGWSEGRSGSAVGAPNHLRGEAVCFTGESMCKFNGQPIDRELAESLARRAGLLPKGNVSRALHCVVAADPATLSGKAEKARQYGIPIIDEREFWKMIGVAVEA